MTPAEQIAKEIRAELLVRINSYTVQIESLRQAAAQIKELEALRAAAQVELEKYPEKEVT